MREELRVFIPEALLWDAPHPLFETSTSTGPVRRLSKQRTHQGANPTNHTPESENHESFERSRAALCLFSLPALSVCSVLSSAPSSRCLPSCADVPDAFEF